MTFIPKPKLHHPDLPNNALGFTRRDYEGAISTLCAGCGHDSISAAIVRACFELSICRRTGSPSCRDRLLVEDADLFPRRVARLQLRAWAHAVGADRREPGQSRPDLSRRLRRRGFGLDRFRAVRPFDAPRREHGLYRREQWRLRPDQRPVLRHRRQGREVQARRRQYATRRSTSSAWRFSLARPSWPQLLRRQGPARAADQGGDRATRARPSSTASRPASPSTTTRAPPRVSIMCASTTRR